MEDGKSPELLQGIELDLSGLKLPDGFKNAKAEIYDPWQDAWKTASRNGNNLKLPDFKRSLVVRLSAGS
jgi:hypothetical protein